MKLEVGKRYICRNGLTVGPLEDVSDRKDGFPFRCPLTLRTYTPEGSYIASGPCDLDLVEEVLDSEQEKDDTMRALESLPASPSPSPRISVYPVGSIISVGRYEAKVISIQIKANNAVSYQIVWWDGPTRHTEWIEACEVESPSTQLGFIKLES